MTSPLPIAQLQAQLQIEVPRREVLRYMGYPRGRDPSRRVQTTLDRLWIRGLQLARPRGCFAFVSGDAAAGAAMPRPSDRVGVGLCTIDAVLEREAAAAAAAGSMLTALILDAFGSAAAEAAADALEVLLCREAASQQLHAARRISPGYGRWPVAGQQRLLGLLPASELGVTLSPGLMMSPRKSVSFACRLEREPTRRSPGSRCLRCGMRRCAYRREEE